MDKVYAIYFVNFFWYVIINKKVGEYILGILKNIKKMFSKNIDCADELEGKSWYLYSSKNREIKVGANIIVPHNFFAVFVCKDKVCDVLREGKFAINGANMPKTFSIMKLGKANKHGNFKKRFIGDVYYITSLKQCDIEFESYDKYYNKSAKFGTIKALSQGLFNMEITDPDKLLKYMLSERAVVNEDLFFDLLGGLVGNYINKKLEVLFEDFYYILINPTKVNEKLNVIIDMEEYFSDYGFKISNVRFQSLNVSTKLKKHIEEELKNVKKSDIMSHIDIEIPVMQEVTVDLGEEFTTSNDNPQKEKCLKCGQELRTGAMFCDKCGNKVNNLN